MSSLSFSVLASFFMFPDSYLLAGLFDSLLFGRTEPDPELASAGSLAEAPWLTCWTGRGSGRGCTPQGAESGILARQAEAPGMRMAVGSWRWRWAGLPRGWQCGVGEQSWGRYMAWLQSEPEGVEFSITEDVLTVVDVIVDSDTMVEFIGAIGL